MKQNDYSLYFVTDRDLMTTSTLDEAVVQAIEGGITMLQLREKEMNSRGFYDEAIRIKAITEKKAIPLIINDRLDIALAINADGIHIGQEDLPATIVRKLIGSQKIMGVSASSLEEAVDAEKNGADYIGVGAMYSTKTKTDATVTSFNELKEIVSTVSIPVVVIGGINYETMNDFQDINVSGFAIVSDIIASKKILSSTIRLRKRAESILR